MVATTPIPIPSAVVGIPEQLVVVVAFVVCMEIAKLVNLGVGILECQNMEYGVCAMMLKGEVEVERQEISSTSTTPSSVGMAALGNGAAIFCLLAVACADKLGYNYQPVAHSEQGLSFVPGASGHELPQQSLVQQAPIQQASIQHAAPIQQTSSQVSQPAPLIEEYEKEFYSYSAPEEEFDDGASNQRSSNSLKRNLRVLFIRTPENQGLANAALSLARQATDERTAIYVLTKQADVGNLAKQLENQKSQSRSIPEVHFVKYRTPQDAAHAQQAIQSQYNSLPGASHSDQGTANVLNFASKATGPATNTAPASPHAQYLPANPVPSQQYLPSSLRRLRL
ncbi:uncharacterized protein LOC119676089 [Teleopsis dalmanni]|uniref:uncharacterized protein LOC119676089 n=1 Tax=Teleopsis dalmanni TaxID=139649 RepID=UPI0018CDBF05|nr:uncharacterized protein LOC119676089 [Teleopsis dalmanni]